jgi:hypothetical protein
MQSRLSESKVYHFWYAWFVKRWPPSEVLGKIENEMIRDQEIGAYQSWVEKSLNFMLSSDGFFPYHPKTLTDKVFPPLSSKLMFPQNIFMDNGITRWICPTGWLPIKNYIARVAIPRMKDGLYDGRDQLWIENNTPFYIQDKRDGYPFTIQNGMMGVQTNLNVSAISKEKFVHDIASIWKALYPRPQVVSKPLFTNPNLRAIVPGNQHPYNEWVEAWGNFIEKRNGGVKSQLFPYLSPPLEDSLIIHPLIVLADGVKRSEFYLSHRIVLPQSIDDPEAFPTDLEAAGNVQVALDYLYQMAFNENVGYSSAIREKKYNWLVEYLVYYFSFYLEGQSISKFQNPIVRNTLKKELPIFDQGGLFPMYSTPIYWEETMVYYENPEIKDDRPGLFHGLPTPTAVTDPNVIGPLTPSIHMECPDEIILAYWRELIATFRKQNPRLVLNQPAFDNVNNQMYHYERDMTSDPLTDRIGFKSIISKNDKKRLSEANNTSDLVLVNETFSKFLPHLDDYLFKNCLGFLSFTGAVIPLESLPVDDDMKRNLKKWQNAILQATHLRLAERHFFSPWEEWRSIPQELSQFPSDEIIEERISATDFPKILDWKYMCWSDNFYNAEQVKQRRPFGWFPGNYDTVKQLPPDVHPDLSSAKANGQLMAYWEDTLAFVQLKSILKEIDQSKKNVIELKLKPKLYQAFAQWVYHYQFSFPVGYDPINNLVSKGYYQQIFNMDSFSNPNTWKACLQYWLNQCYQELSNCPQPYLYQLTYPLINTKNFQEAEPKAPLPGPAPGSGYKWDTFDRGKLREQLEAVWESFKLQWLATQDLVDWPTYQWNGRNYVLKDGGVKPIPSAFQKILNTIWGWLAPSAPNPDFAGNLGDIPNEADEIYGFFLPNSEMWCPEIVDLYRFVRRYPLPPLNQTPLLWSNDSISWDKTVAQQWDHYQEWVEKNLEMKMKYDLRLEEWKKNKEKIEEPKYIAPGRRIMNLKGEAVTMIHPTTDDVITLYNTWCDMGVVDRSKGKFKSSFGWMFNPGDWAEGLGGSKGSLLALFQTLIKVATSAAQLIIKALGDIVAYSLDKLSEALGLNWGLIGLGFLGVLGVWSYGQLKT